MDDATDDERRADPGAPVTGTGGAPERVDGPDADPASAGAAQAFTEGDRDDAGEVVESDDIRVADAVRTYRAPRIGAFVTAGALLGIVVGLVLALVTGPQEQVVDDGTAFISFLDAEGTVRLLSALTGGVVGAVIAGVVAVVADRRSARRSAGS